MLKTLFTLLGVSFLVIHPLSVSTAQETNTRTETRIMVVDWNARFTNLVAYGGSSITMQDDMFGAVSPVLAIVDRTNPGDCTEIEVPTERGDSEVFSIDWSPDGQHLSVGFVDGYVRIWQLDSSSETNARLIQQFMFVPDQSRLPQVNYSPDGKWLAVMAGHHGIQLWRTDQSTYQMQSEVNLGEGIGYQLSWSPDSRAFMIGHTAIGPVIYDVADDGTMTRREGIIGPTILNENGTAENLIAATQLGWSPNGSIIAFNDSFSNRLFLYDTQSRNQVAIHEAPSEVLLLAWSPDGRNLAYGHFWDRPLTTILDTLTMTTTPVLSEGGLGGWSPDGQQLALFYNFDINRQSQDELQRRADSLFNTREFTGVQVFETVGLPGNYLAFPIVAPVSSASSG